MIDITRLPTEAVDYIVGLRKEAAKYRVQRSEARAEVGSLRTTVAHLRSEVQALKAELGR